MSRELEERVSILEKAIEKLGIKIRKKYEIGDTFETAGITWKILDTTKQGYLCLADKLEGEMKFDSGSNNWRDSELREYLNKVFFEKISEAIGEDNIIPFQRDLISLDGQTEYEACEDKISLLTVDEYRKYRNLIQNTGNCWWWLITPWSTKCNEYEKLMAVVSPSGRFGYGYCGSDGAVRPFCIFSSLIFESEE